MPHCVGGHGGDAESRNALTSLLTITIIVLVLVLVVAAPLIFYLLRYFRREKASCFGPSKTAVRADADHVSPANNASKDEQFESGATHQYVASRNSADDHGYCELDEAIYCELDYSYLSLKVSVPEEH